VLPDYHIHSMFSCDGHDSVDALCRRAIELGAREIGISEHCDHHPLDECQGYFQPDLWWQAIGACRQEYRTGLILRAGLELGEPHLFQTQVGTLLEDYPWDYILGSLHWVQDTLIFDLDYFDQPEEQAYRAYLIELLRLVKEADFDILAHMDIVKRYGFDCYGKFDPKRWEGEIRTILHELARSDRALEVNTNTLRRPVGETSPTSTILRWFREEGGRYVSFGSDAHKVRDLAAGWQQAVSELRKAGFSEYATYHLRQPERHPLLDIGETHS
jgi:histidinol-phosphatase (PHP family)